MFSFCRNYDCMIILEDVFWGAVELYDITQGGVSVSTLRKKLERTPFWKEVVSKGSLWNKGFEEILQSMNCDCCGLRCIASTAVLFSSG